MDLLNKLQLKLEAEVAETHPNETHVFQPLPDDPQRCGICNWMSTNHPDRPKTEALLEKVKKGEVTVIPVIVIDLIYLPSRFSGWPFF